MVGVSVALAGAIGFIGLVIPHILRLCGLSDHRVLLPACMLAGASALLGADIIARLALSAAELPIGVVTATLGAPVFIWLLLRSRGRDSAAPSAGTAPVQAYQPLIASPL
ncbi:Vitamin B12 import system permease protein BtuC [Serratia liquefaciens]|nr:Vitamin B12 import system permease protein BtuC [Serratia liquefaciens]